MRSIAAPIVGGLATSFVLELTVYPAIYAVWKRRGARLANSQLSLLAPTQRR